MIPTSQNSSLPGSYNSEPAPSSMNVKKANPNCVARYTIIDSFYGEDAKIQSSFKQCLETSGNLQTLENKMQMQKDAIQSPTVTDLTVCHSRKWAPFKDFSIEYRSNCQHWDYLAVSAARKIIDNANETM